MSANASQPTNAAHRRSGAGPGRVVAIVASVFLLVIGACLALGGGLLLVVFGSDGSVSTAKHPVGTPTAAVTTDVATIRDTAEVADALGTPVATVAANGGNTSGLFIGIGPAVAVDRYLSGVAVDQVVDFDVDPYTLNLDRRGGIRTTATSPAEQNIWVASTTGTGNLQLNWPVRDGNFRLVVMNADGSAGVNSQLSIGASLGGMFGLALGLLIGGAVLIILAVVLLVVSRPRPPTIVYAPSTGPPAPAGPEMSTSDQVPERPDAPSPNR
jgi:hypothetical protein